MKPNPKQSPIEELIPIIGPDRVRLEPETLMQYGQDWTRFFKVAPLAIAFPKTKEQVREVVLWARRNKVALVPSGGRTGLSGGAVASHGELVVSFEKMNAVLDFNESDLLLKCEAGVVTEEIQKFAQERQLFYPVDFAARGSSQIGGNVATNAGGIKVVRYGLTRDWVAGLTVVTGSGEILKLNQGLVKNASGYDLRHLFIGSEGTLGFIVEVEVRLTRAPRETHVLLLGVSNLAEIMEVFSQARRTLPLTAFEMFSDLALSHVLKHHPNLKRPLSAHSEFYALIEFEEENPGTLDQALTLFESLTSIGTVTDGVLSQGTTQSAELWKFREYISESLAPHTPYKNDISVRISRATDFMLEADKILSAAYPDFEVVWFGHIGDGNLHINVLRPKNLTIEQFKEACLTVDELLYELIEKHSGSVSAEHGVGLTKKRFLKHCRSPSEIAIMKSIKNVFDPDQIMNPGKLL